MKAKVSWKVWVNRLSSSVPNLTNMNLSDRRKWCELISDVKNDMSIIKENTENFGEKADKQKQYSLHDCLLLHNVVENEDENIDGLFLKIVNGKMNIEPPSSDWDRTHRIGWKKESYRKLRTVIVKFISYNTRKQIFSKKKQLKSTGTSITEKRMSKNETLFY